jgi:hypothetical protein
MYMRFEPGDEVRYDGIPTFNGTVLEYIEDHEMAVNDLVDDAIKRGPAFMVLTDLINKDGQAIFTWVWADDQCLVSAS